MVEDQSTPAGKKLHARNAEFTPEVISLTKNVHVATGYDVSNIIMVEGETGVVMIDAGMIPREVKKMLAAFKEISSKPVVGIIFTHGHGDHTRGAGLFMDNENIQVWARENYGSESLSPHLAGYKNPRAINQAGILLPPSSRINQGIAPTRYGTPDGQPLKLPEPGQPAPPRPAFKEVEPTHTFSGDVQKLNLGGINLELHKAPGETGDGLFVWLPDEKVLCAGDNFYKSWPNLYAIRGTTYRNVLAWSESLTHMLTFETDHLVGGHTRPVSGAAEVKEVLTNYRDAVKFVFDKTIEGMNKGMNPDELVEYVQLPDHLRGLDYLHGYYGRVDWSVRSIHNGYLGWFDGNPTNLIPFSKKVEAEKLVGLMGGYEKVLNAAAQALIDDDFQLASQLSDYLIALDPKDAQPLKVKKSAMTGLANHVDNALARNYYLTVALKLDKRMEKLMPADN